MGSWAHIMLARDVPVQKVPPENDKICPKCKSRLVHNFTSFLGCENFPSCNYTEKYKK